MAADQPVAVDPSPPNRGKGRGKGGLSAPSPADPGRLWPPTFQDSVLGQRTSRLELGALASSGKLSLGHLAPGADSWTVSLFRRPSTRIALDGHLLILHLAARSLLPQKERDAISGYSEPSHLSLALLWRATADLFVPVVHIVLLMVSQSSSISSRSRCPLSSKIHQPSAADVAAHTTYPRRSSSPIFSSYPYSQKS